MVVFGCKIKAPQATAEGEAVVLGGSGTIPQDLLPETSGGGQITVIDARGGSEVLSEYTDAATITQDVVAHPDDMLLLNFVMGPNDFELYYIGAVILFPENSSGRRAAHGTVNIIQNSSDYMDQAMGCSIFNATVDTVSSHLVLDGVGYSSGDSGRTSVELDDMPINARLRILNTSGGGGTV